jgi:hypothetical protein
MEVVIAVLALILMFMSMTIISILRRIELSLNDINDNTTNSRKFLSDISYHLCNIKNDVEHIKKGEKY